jgi:hypothetical protein
MRFCPKEYPLTSPKQEQAMTKKNTKTNEEFKKAAKMTAKKKPAAKKPSAKKPAKTKEEPPVFRSPFGGRGGCWGTGRGGMGW